MNFTRLPDRTAEEVRNMVEAQTTRISSPNITQGIRAFLIRPRLAMRTWGWNKPLVDYPVWIVAESSRFDYGIAFSDYGFAPECPWGLVFLSHSDFDADYCWYSTLEEAYKNSRLYEEYEENRKQG